MSSIKHGGRLNTGRPLSWEESEGHLSNLKVTNTSLVVGTGDKYFFLYIYKILKFGNLENTKKKQDFN